MRQRGRRSASDLAILPAVSGTPARLEPPEHLTEAERKVFLALVDAVDPKHFARADLPLLATYCQATVITQETAHEPSNFATWEKAAKLQAVLATRLRLAPQARFDARAAARHQKERTGPQPWEI